MRLGMIHGWDESCLRDVARKGLSCVEFCINVDYSAEKFLAQAPQILEYAKKYNVSVGSVGRWGQPLVDSDGKVIPETAKAYRDIIDAAALLGCPVFNCGCNPYAGNVEENCEAAIKALRDIVAYARDKGVKPAVYNCSWENCIHSPERWAIVLPELDGLGIKYDTSHCIARGNDYLVETRDWADRFYHVHLKGTVRVGGQGYDDAPMGLDQTDWPSFFDILYTRDYNEMVSIEPHSAYWGSGPKADWGVRFSIDYARRFIMPDDYNEEDYVNDWSDNLDRG